MIKLYKANEYKIKPWKNKQGSTSEIRIQPANADFAQDDFLWRLSSAKVQSPNFFSQFEGYDRILAVIRGDGLILNDRKLEPLIPYSFPGENPVHCRLISGEVQDLGFIYKRGKIKAQMQVIDFDSMKESFSIRLPEGLHFLFCVTGKMKINELILDELDTVEIEGPLNIQISAIELTKCIVINVIEKQY